jgi:hypothetical protein
MHVIKKRFFCIVLYYINKNYLYSLLTTNIYIYILEIPESQSDSDTQYDKSRSNFCLFKILFYI